MHPRLGSPPPPGSSFPALARRRDPHPTRPSPAQRCPLAPSSGECRRTPSRPGRRASGLRRRLSAGTWRRGPAGAERAGRLWEAREGRGHRAGGDVCAAPGPVWATAGAASLRARAGRVAPPRGSWRRAGPAILGRGVGRPVPGLELLVINGPQLLAICLHVQSLTEQEILEALARLPELPAAELTGHRGGGCGPGRGSVEMKLKVAAAAGSWLP